MRHHLHRIVSSRPLSGINVVDAQPLGHLPNSLRVLLVGGEGNKELLYVDDVDDRV